MPRRAVALALAAFAGIGAVLWVPWAVKDRVVTASTPVPPAIFGGKPAPVKGGQTACITNVTFDRRTRIGEIGVDTGSRRGPRIAIDVKAPGYRAHSEIPGGYRSSPSTRFTITPPDAPVRGDICFRNTGRSAIELAGTDEFRTMGRPDLTIDGVHQPMDAKLVFYDRGRESYASRAGEIMSNAAIFTPAFFSQAALIVLALLALVGIPVAILAALATAARED